MTECPKCKSQKVAAGHFSTRGHSNSMTVSFVPGELKWYQFSMDGGAELETEVFACSDCGLVWTDAAYPEALRELVNQFKKPE